MHTIEGGIILTFDDLNLKQQEVIKRYAQQVQGSWDTFKEPIKAGYLYRTFHRAAARVALTHSAITDILENLDQIVAFRTPKGGVAFMPKDAWIQMSDSERLALIESMRHVGEFRYRIRKEEPLSSPEVEPLIHTNEYNEYSGPKSIRDFLPEDLPVPVKPEE